MHKNKMTRFFTFTSNFFEVSFLMRVVLILSLMLLLFNLHAASGVVTLEQSAFAERVRATNIDQEELDRFFSDCGWDLQCGMNKAIFTIAQFFAFFISFSITIITIAIDPVVLDALFNLESLYATWGIVRDLFNIIFIFVLLFSAFATIFQVQKYHLKTIILNVVLMALLINFSWPIARVIIDLSNQMMYFFLNGQSGVGLMGEMAQGSRFAELAIYQEDANIGSEGQTVNVLFVVVFTFIFAMTMLTIALQLFIRTTLLMVLIIFSPIGIAGSAIPRMQGLSSQWWDAFIKQCFAGPIMVFMLIFALSTTLLINDDDSDITKRIEGSATSTATSAWRDRTILATQYAIPLIILWVGIAAASKLSDKASSFVQSNVRRLPRAVGRYGATRTKRYAKTSAQGVYQMADKRSGFRLSKAVGAVTGSNRAAYIKERDKIYNAQKTNL